MRKYLLYAIGEILLVMVGILLALQVNNWNEGRKDRREELAILRGLKNEFLVNQHLLADRMTRLQDAISFSDQFIEQLTSAEYSAKDIGGFVDRFTYGNAGSETTNLSFGVIDALLSTDDINLIRNDTLKLQLTNWRDLADDFAENERLHLDFALNRLDILISQAVPTRNFSDISPADAGQKLMELGRNLVFRNYVISDNGYMTRHVQPKCEEVMRTIMQINELIEREIKGLEQG